MPACVCKKIFQRWRPVPMSALLNKRPKASSVNVAVAPVGVESLTNFSPVHFGKLSCVWLASPPEHQRFHDNNHKKSWTYTFFTTGDILKINPVKENLWFVERGHRNYPYLPQNIGWFTFCLLIMTRLEKTFNIMWLQKNYLIGIVV